MNLFNNTQELISLVHKLNIENVTAIKEQLFKAINELEEDIYSQKEYVSKFLDEARKELNNNRKI